MTKRITKIKYKVFIIRDGELFERKYSTADEIINDLQSGLTKNVIYRKVRTTSGRGHHFTGFRSTPHQHIKIFKVNPAEDWTPHDRVEQMVIY